eukprot:TRINITY_DN49254_c0_g1_i1.p1 TRINITY_DN49254_c0_g1~~TRINITY_DN49254_c0_g1_i1.p1  ORF type:complete len:289 (-),score=67.69 TRINITY_DN49254_c0_g1_i1:255-1037(-)
MACGGLAAAIAALAAAAVALSATSASALVSSDARVWQRRGVQRVSGSRSAAVGDHDGRDGVVLGGIFSEAGLKAVLHAKDPLQFQSYVGKLSTKLGVRMLDLKYLELATPFLNGACASPSFEELVTLLRQRAHGPTRCDDRLRDANKATSLGIKNVIADQGPVIQALDLASSAELGEIGFSSILKLNVSRDVALQIFAKRVLYQRKLLVRNEAMFNSAVAFFDCNSGNSTSFERFASDLAGLVKKNSTCGDGLLFGEEAL